MRKIRILIIDDEPLARIGVIERLRNEGDMEIVAESGSGTEALFSIARTNPDVVFLDIRMPDISGIQLVKGIPLEERPVVVFLTAHEEHALDAFECEALDYLLKPIDDERFSSCVDRMRRLLALKQHAEYAETQEPVSERYINPENSRFIQSFIVRQGTSVCFVKASEIDWIEGLGNYAGLHAGPSTYLIREAISTIAAKLAPWRFLRIHRSHIVQLDRIVRVHSLTNRDLSVVLKDGTRVRASRSYSSALQRYLRNGLVMDS